MRIDWDPTNAWFRLEFGGESFQADLNLVKKTGFKTTGPPDWIWYSHGVKALKALKKAHPEPIPISAEALDKFKSFCEEEEKRTATKKLVKELKAKLAPKQESSGEQWVEVKPKPEIKSGPRYVAPAPPETRCAFCGDPVYDYEKLEPLPVCLWCEKTIADEQRGDEDVL